MDVPEYNRNAWNFQSLEGCRWSTPYSAEVFQKVKEGEDWEVVLTPNKAVPSSWFPAYPDLNGSDLLALACGGGQQVPIFAAAGASVTSFDNSDIQLEKDIETCTEHDLSITTMQGDMADLSALKDGSFDLIFNPVSNVFCKDLAPIWKECHRVLRPGGRLLAGFMNPDFFLFDHYEAEETRELIVKHKLPYTDLESLDEETLSAQLEAQVSLEFSHSWEAQIGGQCEAGFAIQGFYEDNWDDESSVLNQWMNMFGATLAIKI